MVLGRRSQAKRDQQWRESREGKESLLLEHAGEHLSHVRRSAGYTQADVAARLGVDQSAIAKIESGDRPLGILEAVKLKNIYNLSSIERLVMPHLLENDGVQDSLEIVGGPYAGLVTKKAMEIKSIVEIALEQNKDLVAEGSVPAVGDVLKLSSDVLTEAQDASLNSVQPGYEAARSLMAGFVCLGHRLPTMEDLCERLGVILLKYPLGYYQNQNYGGFGAAAVSQSGEGYIVINSEISKSHQDTVIAEMLSRLVLGHCGRNEILFTDAGDLIQRDGLLDKDSAIRRGHEWGFVWEILMPTHEIKYAVNNLDSLTNYDLEGIDNRIENIVRLAAHFGTNDFINAARHIGLVIDEEYLERLGFEDSDSYMDAIHKALMMQDGDLMEYRTGRSGIVQSAMLGEVYLSPIVWRRIFGAVERKVMGVERLAQLLHKPDHNARFIIDSMRATADWSQQQASIQ